MHWYPKRWPLLLVEVAEDSMLPELRPGDWLLAQRTRRIRPGQVVLAWHPTSPGLQLVKRTVGRVEGGWWLAADNPAAGGVDSSHFGAVPEELIIGRVLARYWPFPPHRFSRSLSERSRLTVVFWAYRNEGPRPAGGGLRCGLLA